MINLSKQLCEICGIKPHYKCKNVPCLNFIFDTGICNITESVCNPYECKNDYEPDTTHRSWEEGQAVYPDFEQPENFVKLFKLITTIEKFRFTTGNFYIPSIPSYKQDTALTADDEEYYSSNPDPIQAFITCVIKHCRRNKDTADYIRETEWVYE